MSTFFRTPDDRFTGLPDFPWAPNFRQWQGLRLAHLDEGDGSPVVMLHGEPTWSFLWRKVMPPLLDAGYRCIVPDLPGFGRSDKPIEQSWYSYDRHTSAVADLVEQLDLRNATLVVHDWGGPIGMRVAVEHPDRFDRLVVMNTGLVTGKQKMSEAWHKFRDFVERTEDLPIGLFVAGACKQGLNEDVVAAYEAPFPTAESKAGARAFPLLLPITPDAAGAAAGRQVLAAMREDTRPKLVLWGAADPILPVSAGERLAAVIGSEPPQLLSEASHFLQEDEGAEVGRLIVNWLKSAR